jgi:hypothetical protein
VLNAIKKGVQTLLLVCSILSLVVLIECALDVGIVEPVKAMLNWYQQLIKTIFDLVGAETGLRAVLKYLKQRMHVDLRVYPHWKYIFVPMWLYFGMDAKTIWRDQRKALGVFTFVWGGLVALAASVFASTVPLDSPSMLPLICPAVGFVLYEGIKNVLATISQSPGISQSTRGHTRRQIFWDYQIAYAGFNALIAGVLVLVYIGLQMWHLDFSSLNIVFLILFVIAMALRNIGVSAVIATVDRAKGQRWIDRFRGLATQRHGFAILVSVAIAVSVTVLGAGVPPPQGCLSKERVVSP